ncbi:hypothetical protein [Kocuria sp. TGY1127_2]|uniref:hypothetical protein n=1 Tax=Kocuria sp. TGY1127_2 TaxID=2711328 RepID=UPI0015B89C43|nr:hypothetical protein [Kocuria sp. TGY1127_2]
MNKATPQQTSIDLPQDHPRPGTGDWILNEIKHPAQNTQRIARLHTCPTCHTMILTGYNDDTAATRTTTDTTTLTPEQATIHAIAGRTLYHLTTTDRTFRLYEIDNPNHPPPLLTNHICGHPPPGQPLLQPPAPQPPANQPPPF